MSWQERIISSLRKQKSENKFRSRMIVEQGTGRFLIQNKQTYWNFSSNDYLNLSHHPKIIRAWKKGAERYGIGSGGSGHINGYTTIHHQLEEELADWLGYSKALLFISGFSANQAVIITLMKKNDCIIADRLSHASLLEAANLSPANLRRFRHNDITSLSSLLYKPCQGEILVVTEGVFSMDGDSAPIDSIHIQAKKVNSWLMVDDAHGFGVIGKNGKGSCVRKKTKPELLVITFGKSAGICGAAVLCSQDIFDYFLQHSSHLIYSTSMPPAQAAALLASLNIIRSNEGEERRQKLFQNISHFQKGVSSLHILSSNSNHAIQPLIIGNNTSTLTVARRLREKKIWTVAIRPPSVPKNTARLRITLSAAHKTTDIFVLLDALHDVCQ